MRKVLASLALVASVLAVIGGAPAQAVGNAQVVFSGTADLTEDGFPCSPDCSGSFDGSATVVTGDLPSGEMHADFTYNEPDNCEEGDAEGNGYIGPVGNRATFVFEWTRVGTVAIISGTFTYNGDDTDFEATAAFAPIGAPVGCADGTPTPLTAEVVGEAHDA